ALLAQTLEAGKGVRHLLAPRDGLHHPRHKGGSAHVGEVKVFTGVSVSGKSTLALDFLFQEGQRRYLESLNA
ncbi:hypothetical protein, partial [Cupriavidus necator]